MKNGKNFTLFKRVFYVTCGLFIGLPKSSFASPNSDSFGYFLSTVSGKSLALKLNNYSKQETQYYLKRAEAYRATSVYLTPYKQTGVNELASLLTSGQSNGYKYGVSQESPFGLKLFAEFDKKNQNSLSSVSNELKSSTLGVSVSLLKNFLGTADRAENQINDYRAKEFSIDIEIQSRQACNQLISQIITLWAIQKKLKILNSLKSESNKLKQTFLNRKKRGEVSKLDFNGAQVDFLNLENQSLLLNRQFTIGARDFELQLESPIEKNTIPEPDTFLNNIFQSSIKENQGISLSHQKNKIKGLSAFRTAHLAESNSLPNLLFTLERSNSEGQSVGGGYTNENTLYKVDFIYKFNDTTAQSAKGIANLERSKSEIDSKISASRESDLTQFTAKVLTDDFNFIKNETEKIQYLDQIRSAYLEKFLQGRIEFQDYLRQKEIWSGTVMNLIDKKNVFWTAVLDHFHNFENNPNICEVSPTSAKGFSQ